jgi:heme-degrading monooxygenase HmoA
MIARIWRGATSLTDAEAYVEYLRRTGLKDYRETPGNRGAYILWRELDGKAEFITLSLWDSTEAITGFAGKDIERAVFYPDDDAYLVDRDLTVTHYRVIT